MLAQIVDRVKRPWIPGPGQRLSSTSVASLVIGALVLLLGATMVAPRPTLAGLLGLIVVAVCVAALYRITLRGPFAPVAITFWAFVVVWVGFAPLLQIRDNRLPWKDTPLTQLYPIAQMVLFLAITAFWLGYARPSAARVSQPDRRLEFGVRGAVAVTAGTLLLAAFSIPVTGGLAVRFTNRDSLKAAIQDAGLTGGPDQAMMGLLNTLPAAASLAALVLCIRCLRNRSYADRRSRSILIGATCVSIALNLTYNNPLSATRFATFSVALAVALALLDFSKPWLRAGFVWAMVGGLAVIYPLADMFRNEARQANFRLGAEAYYTYDFDGFQQTVNAIYYTETHGHTWGHQLSSALMFWIPRSLWDGKAVPAGIVVADSRGYKFQNLALPFWAEVFMEFSWVGVALLFFGYGWLAKRLDTVILQQKTSILAILATIVAACQIGFLRGPTGSQIPFVATALVVALGSVAFGRRGREAI